MPFPVIQMPRDYHFYNINILPIAEEIDVRMKVAIYHTDPIIQNIFITCARFFIFCVHKHAVIPYVRL